MLSSTCGRLVSRSPLRTEALRSFVSAPRSAALVRSLSTESRQSEAPKTSFAVDNGLWKRVGLGALIGVGIAIGSQFTRDEVVADEVGLDPKTFKKFKLEKIQDVNYNTKIFRFSLPNKKAKLDLPVASYLLTKGPDGQDGKPTIRPYTPISESDQQGSFDLMIKRYKGGAMSEHFFNMKVGDELEIKGPMKKWAYHANEKRKIGMIAGGTGVTPMVQIAREILRNQADQTEVQLVFCNVKEEDILMRKELDEMASKHKNFKVSYLLEQPPNNWKSGVGRVTPETIKSLMPSPSDDSMVLVCGPDPMVAAISGSKAKDYSQGELTGMLKAGGYTSDNVYKF